MYWIYVFQSYISCNCYFHKKEGTIVNFRLNSIMVLDTAVTMVTSCHVLNLDGHKQVIPVITLNNSVFSGRPQFFSMILNRSIFTSLLDLKNDSHTTE